jgi:hypothetical protein
VFRRLRYPIVAPLLLINRLVMVGLRVMSALKYEENSKPSDLRSNLR